jgi:hypothetical protein
MSMIKIGRVANVKAALAVSIAANGYSQFQETGGRSDDMTTVRRETGINLSSTTKALFIPKASDPRVLDNYLGGIKNNIISPQARRKRCRRRRFDLALCYLVMLGVVSIISDGDDETGGYIRIK